MRREGGGAESGANSGPLALIPPPPAHLTLALTRLNDPTMGGCRQQNITAVVSRDLLC